MSPANHEDLRMTPVDINPANPFRAPDWRWRSAVHPHELLAKPHRRVDRWTRQAIRLRERFEADGTPKGRRRTQTDVVLADAHALRYAVDPGGRWEAEARLAQRRHLAALGA
jgi:hypothetical protein